MRRGVIFLFLLLGLGGGLALFPLWTLSLSSSNEILYLRIVQAGDTFHLGYLHSIALSDVWESFLIDSERRIVLTETRFQGQGAGLPSILAPGEQLTREGRWFRISGMKRVVPCIYWRVQGKWHNRFRFGQDPELDLSAKVKDALIHIQVQERSLASWLGIYLKSKIT